MSEQIAYALITDNALTRFRTGGIVARLIARTGLHLVGARMFAPSQKCAEEYALLLRKPGHTDCEKMRTYQSDYVLRELAHQQKTGKKSRVMILLFQGEDAIAKIHSVVSGFLSDTYREMVFEGEKLLHFEPSVLAAQTLDATKEALRLFAKYDADGGVVRNNVPPSEGETAQLTLTMIKPDSFGFPMGRPGNILDFFASTGLQIAGIKVQQMSTAQAMEFYGPVRDVLRTKLAGKVAKMVRSGIEKTLECTLDDDTAAQVGALLCPTYGDSQFDNIVRFMSGRSESECPKDELHGPGTVESWVVLFEGPDAIAKIRNVLGPTDPSKASPGTIRREFGTDVMVNAAHASDSEESVAREMEILVYKSRNSFKAICEKFINETR